MIKHDSWFMEDWHCKECGSNIVVCQSKDKDYFYYCSQKYCKNHTGTEQYDMDDFPDFVELDGLINKHK